MLEVILATAKATGPLWATWSSESAQLIWFKHHQLRGAATSVHPVTEAWTVAHMEGGAGRGDLVGP